MGDFRPSLGVLGDTLLESLEALTGVNWSCRKKGRSGNTLEGTIDVREWCGRAGLLAADMSTFGGGSFPGFEKCVLEERFRKPAYESSGGVANHSEHSQDSLSG
jgi:hypothetical protein